MRDFLLEIHTEELPPKSLLSLGKHLLQEIQSRLIKSELTFKEAKCYMTPRSLSVLVKKLSSQSPPRKMERKGPALSAAYDMQGHPTPACLGFARSCGVTPAELVPLKTAQGEWVSYWQTVTGQMTVGILPVIVQEALAALPIARRMRWGDSAVEFVRPVHSVILLYGKEVVPAVILGVTADRKTRGHRFHAKGWVNIASPSSYLKKMANQCVLADFLERREKIQHQVNELVERSMGASASALMSADLLDEVTGLVEWPVALCGDFDPEFLEVPQEVLISAMQDHQRYFPVVDTQGKLLPYFITVSNIESQDPVQVIHGNERVLRARLSDAAFFFTTDQQQKLADRVDRLKNMVFQQQLGTLYDKTQRLVLFIEKIAEKLMLDTAMATRAAWLSKADLTTQLVGEFPELQGTAGHYYALHDQEPSTVAVAIAEQYFPRFSGDRLPGTLMGCALALADRLDTLLGVFGIGQAPTGDKDPLGLRRAALGALRILIEKQLDLDLLELLGVGLSGYGRSFAESGSIVQSVWNFIVERLKPWYQEQRIGPDVLAAVMASGSTRPCDIHRRILAVEAFKQLPEAQALSIANKRVSHILHQYTDSIIEDGVNINLFEHAEERVLLENIQKLSKEIRILHQSAEYTTILQRLASLRAPVDAFFEKVLVMAEDKAKRENRLLLLKHLRELFLYVADVALLQ